MIILNRLAISREVRAAGEIVDARIALLPKVRRNNNPWPTKVETTRQRMKRKCLGLITNNEREDDAAPQNSEEASNDGNATATTEKVQYT